MRYGMMRSMSNKRRFGVPSRTEPMSTLAKIVIATALVFVLIAAVGIGVWSDTRNEVTVVAPPVPYPTPERVGPEPVNSVWIGDSFTLGTGATKGQGFVDLLDKELCWGNYKLAEGGTGYINKGQRDPNSTVFAQRVDKLAQFRPRLIIVQGGLNDRDPTVGAVATELYTQLKAKYPRATIVVLGPLNTPKTTYPETRDALRQAAEGQGLQFIDTYGWLTPDQFFEDGVHPNPEGHRVYTDNLKRFFAPEWNAC